ncbi:MULTISPECIES: ribosome small subunit-dependent GTPase A [Roseobacteraceae]|uniref:ribosome small subunit-dependent GTPase A n=1 Tax=Roseobacteraceae TaxID=2854170 RepID=UPI00125F78AC|nr:MULTISPECIES: ribosome small subunit-dependent GTPase A [Roseobacteraceae]KAB6715989.1 ribosome small subunit-dependent GTPase A [Roseobacter sp. TSBP12]|tara:strand:- start:608 stop:1666 length:1059 start_codon:yes stop_codon:yes gene_type:complete
MTQDTTSTDLKTLGWSQFFTSQLSIEELETLTPMRLSEVRRRSVVALSARLERLDISLTGDHVATDMAVGDFVLSDGERIIRRLDRRTLISRRAAGVAASAQLIAANIDTLFITTSCNTDFNEARLERYLAIAIEAEATPVIVITKADKPEDIPVEAYVDRAKAIYDQAEVLAINAKDPADIARLEHYCGTGQTLALVGSSGVGKSTIARGLTGEDLDVGDIREDDAKGRHTTTARSMHRMHAGGWLIDTPGMRELALHDAMEGIGTLFEDITDLAMTCKFSDCQHRTEPGCAIRAAIETGELDEPRVERWRKLMEEDSRNSESISEARGRGRKFSKMVKQAKKVKSVKRGE